MNSARPQDQPGREAEAVRHSETPALPAGKHVALGALFLLIVNLLIVARLFGVEYSAYTGSVEGTFLAIPRILAKFPGQWRWWPFWNGGLPFECAYLPFTHWLTAGFILLTHLSAGRSYHIVSAAVYALGAPAFFWMAVELSRRYTAGMIAALTNSCLSFSALLIPPITADSGGPLILRRLQSLVFYAEAPHLTALVLLPVAIVCFSRAIERGGVKWQLLAGVASAAMVLSNAFGVTVLPVALICWLIAYPSRPWWRAPLQAGITGLLVFCWVSPWLSPALIRAIRANAATTGGDFRYTPASWILLAALAAAFIVLSAVLRRRRVPPYLTFVLLFGLVMTVVTVAGSVWNVSVIAQPGRYQDEVDFIAPLIVIFTGALLLDRFPLQIRRAAVALAMIALTAQTVYTVHYAHRLIRRVDVKQLSEYKLARWLEVCRQSVPNPMG